MWAAISCEKWLDWHWQLQAVIRTVNELNDVLASFTALRVPISPLVDKISQGHFSCKVTPYMVVALKEALEAAIPGAWEAFRWSFTPSELEYARLEETTNGTDCIGEELPDVNPVPSVTNFYRNRVLFRVTTMCPAYCRYCFRRRMVGDGSGAWDNKTIQDGLLCIRKNSEIREVILSGGDPLVLSDTRLAHILRGLKAIPHVHRLRIDTKALTMMPQRITEGLIKLLREHQPFYVIGHFTHLYELTEETRGACARLIDAGIPVLAHTPLLKGVNDTENNLSKLMESLVDCRIKPYYLIQFIPTKWTEHFRVPIARGLQLMQYIHGHCGGLAAPTYIVYLPNGAGKVPVTPQYMREHTSEGYIFENLNGRRTLYPEPIGWRPAPTMT